MHVLTKIFIVLVSLLTVLLVPLVVTYAHNENSYQAKYQSESAKVSAAQADLAVARSAFGAQEITLNAQIQQKTNENHELRVQINERERDIAELNARLAAAEDMDDDIRSQLATLSSSVDASQRLNNSLIEELRALRADTLLAQRQKVEIDEALRDALAQLDVAIQARRGLEEELQRLKDDHASAIATVQRYMAAYGEVDSNVSIGDIPIGIDLDARVVEVRRSADQVLAEIDAGSVDGIREGWTVPISGPAGFVANLKIIRVDVNRSTGIVELENPETRGRVVEGNKIIIRSN